MKTFTNTLRLLMSGLAIALALSGTGRAWAAPMQMPTSVQADLSVSLTHTPAAPVLGDTFSFEVEVRNRSSVAAVHPRLTLAWDPRQRGLFSFTSVLAAGWDCATSDADLQATCTRETLPAGAGATLRFSLHIDRYTTASVNSATISADSEDPDTGNNQATAEVGIAVPSGNANLSIERDPYSPRGPSAPGSLVAQALNVQNQIGGTPTIFTGTYQSPASGHVIGAYGLAYDCATDATTAHCATYGAADGGNKGWVVYTFAPTASGVYTHTYRVDGIAPDPDASNNTGSFTTEVASATSVADLVLSASITPTTVRPGTLSKYTLVVTNTGPEPAHDVSVIVPFKLAQRIEAPQNAIIYGSLPAHNGDWLCDSHYGTMWRCTRPALANGESARLDIPFTAPNTPGHFVDEVAVGSATADVNLANNIVALSLTVTNDTSPQAHYGMGPMTRSNIPLAVPSGSEVTVNFTTLNQGPDAAEQAYLLITFDDMGYIGHTAPAGWTCDAPTLRQMECRKASVPVGSESWALTLRTPTVGPTTNRRVFAYVNSATADVGHIYQFGGVNSVDTIVSSHVADLNLNLRDFPDPVNAGGLITYTMDISNAGPDTNSGYVWLTTIFTPVLPIVRVIAPEWYAYPAGPNTWSAYGLYGLRAGRGARVQFVVLAPSTTGVVTNTTTIWGSELENSRADNIRTVTTTVELGAITADLGVSQSADTDSICTASTFTLSTTVINAGPDVATHPYVNIGLPEGASFTSAEGPWLCAINSVGGGGIRCTGDGLAVGASANIIIHAIAPTTPSVASVLSIAGADERDYNRDDNTHRLPLTISAACSVAASIDWYTVDGGGTSSATDGTLTLGGTSGQPDAGLHQNGSLSLHGGFWQSLLPSLSPSAANVWLPFVMR